MTHTGSEAADGTAGPRDEFLAATFWHGRIARARALLDAHPDLAAADIFTAAAVGDDQRVARFLDASPALATTSSTFSYRAAPMSMRSMRAAVRRSCSPCGRASTLTGWLIARHVPSSVCSAPAHQRAAFRFPAVMKP